MIQWQYKWVRTPLFKDAATLLSDLGREGWELCAIDYSHFILKRPLPDTIPNIGPR